MGEENNKWEKYQKELCMIIRMEGGIAWEKEMRVSTDNNKKNNSEDRGFLVRGDIYTLDDGHFRSKHLMKKV
jgi:hypothetical protein